MKSDRLQQEVRNCREHWETEYRKGFAQIENEYDSAVRTNQMVEKDIQNYLSYYNWLRIAKELVICFLCGLACGALSHLFAKDLDTVFFVLGAAAYAFFRRHPAVDPATGRPDLNSIRANPELRHILNPNLFDIFRVRLNWKGNADAARKKLEAEKASAEEKKARLRADCDRKRDEEIELLKREFKENLNNAARQMQSSQYPSQIGRTMMPEVQKMIRAHRVIDRGLKLRIRVEGDEIVFSTSTGMERKISFSSCGLSVISDFYQKCALATLTARQAQLEFAKAAPGVTTGVEQNDKVTEVSVLRT